MIQSNPFFGVGYNNYSKEFLEYQEEYFRNDGNENNLYYSDDVKSSFNEFLQIFAETGIIGLIVFLLILFSFFKLGFSILKYSNGKYTFLIKACIFSNIIILVHSCFNSNLHILPIQLLFILNLSLVSYYSIYLPDNKKPKSYFVSLNLNKKLKYVLIISTVFICGYLEYNERLKTIAYYHWQEGINKVFIEEWSEAIANYKQAEKYFSNNRELQFFLGTSYLNNDNPHKAIYYLKESLKGFKDKNTYVSLGFAYMQLKKYKQAEAYFQELKNKFPNLLLPDLLLAKLYIETNDNQNAKHHLQLVIDKKPKFDNDNAASVKSVAKDMLKKTEVP